MARYQRILLKISGEALSGAGNFGIDAERTDALAAEIAEVAAAGVQIGLVIGGGNIFRGMALAAKNMDRVRGDHMGMLATVINAISMQDSLERAGVKARVMSAIEMRQVAEPMVRAHALEHLDAGRVVLFAAGTSNPYFSTDSGAALRALEVKAQILAKATKVDGVYDKDPHKYSGAVRFPEIGYTDFLTRGLKVMDATSIAMCRDNHMPVSVFNLEPKGNIMRMAMGEPIGTVIRDL